MINRVILIGRLGRDPELRFTPSGSGVCSFPLATTEKWTDNSGDKQERTEWSQIVVWGKLAETCDKYLHKGRMVYVEGKLYTTSYENKEKVTVYKTEIVAREVKFLSDSSKSDDQSVDQQKSEPGQENYSSDDIPF